MEVCPLTRISSPAPEIYPMFSLPGCVLHGKSIPVTPWPNGMIINQYQ